MDAGKPALERLESSAEAAHERISTGVLNTARWLDSFFHNEMYNVEENKTVAEFGVSSFMEEGAGPDLSTNANVKLALPYLERRVHLLFAGEGDEREDELAATAEETRRSAFLRYFLRAAKDETISADGGMNFVGFRPILFWRARYRKTYPLPAMKARFTQWLKWYTTDGYEIQTILDLDKRLGETYFFRASLNGNWYERKNGYFYNLGFVLFHPFDEDRAVFYEWNNAFATLPYNRLEAITLRAKFRIRVWRKRLVLEAAPQVAFSRDWEFETTPGIMLRLEMDFGYIP